MTTSKDTAQAPVILAVDDAPAQQFSIWPNGSTLRA